MALVDYSGTIMWASVRVMSMPTSDLKAAVDFGLLRFHLAFINFIVNEFKNHIEICDAVGSVFLHMH